MPSFLLCLRSQRPDCPSRCGFTSGTHLTSSDIPSPGVCGALSRMPHTPLPPSTPPKTHLTDPSSAMIEIHISKQIILSLPFSGQLKLSDFEGRFWNKIWGEREKACVRGCLRSRFWAVGLVLTWVCQPVSVLALRFLPKGWWGTEGQSPPPGSLTPQLPLLIPSPSTHLLLLLETHSLTTASTMTTTGTSIPNRMAAKLDTSGMGQEGVEGETLAFGLWLSS